MFCGKRIRNGLFAASIVCVWALSGCEHLDSLRVSDSSAPAFNATLISRPEEMHYGRGKAGQGGIEFAYERYRGEGTQDIALNHFIGLENGSVLGPQRSTNTARVHHGHVAYNHLFSFGRHFQLEPALGVSYDQFETTAIGSLPASRELQSDGSKWGGVFALTPRWNFNRYVGFEVRLSESGDLKHTEISGSNLALVLSPGSHVSLKAGYYSRGHQFETPPGQSNLETNLHGFSGGITVIF